VQGGPSVDRDTEVVDIERALAFHAG
jgi:hypothetical protein